MIRQRPVAGRRQHNIIQSNPLQGGLNNPAGLVCYLGYVVKKRKMAFAPPLELVHCTLCGSDRTTSFVSNNIARFPKDTTFYQCVDCALPPFARHFRQAQPPPGHEPEAFFNSWIPDAEVTSGQSIGLDQRTTQHLPPGSAIREPSQPPPYDLWDVVPHGAQLLVPVTPPGARRKAQAVVTSPSSFYVPETPLSKPPRHVRRRAGYNVREPPSSNAAALTPLTKPSDIIVVSSSSSSSSTNSDSDSSSDSSSTCCPQHNDSTPQSSTPPAQPGAPPLVHIASSLQASRRLTTGDDDSSDDDEEDRVRKPPTGDRPTPAQQHRKKKGMADDDDDDDDDADHGEADTEDTESEHLADSHNAAIAPTLEPPFTQSASPDTTSVALDIPSAPTTASSIKPPAPDVQLKERAIELNRQEREIRDRMVDIARRKQELQALAQLEQEKELLRLEKDIQQREQEHQHRARDRQVAAHVTPKREGKRKSKHKQQQQTSESDEHIGDVDGIPLADIAENLVALYERGLPEHVLAPFAQRLLDGHRTDPPPQHVSGAALDALLKQLEMSVPSSLIVHRAALRPVVASGSNAGIDHKVVIHWTDLASMEQQYSEVVSLRLLLIASEQLPPQLLEMADQLTHTRLDILLDWGTCGGWTPFDWDKGHAIDNEVVVVRLRFVVHDVKGKGRVLRKRAGDEEGGAKASSSKRQRT